MSQIEVPDWVAVKAITGFAESAGYTPILDDRNLRCMRAALTAALGAWVVPACYRLHQPNHSSEWISGMYGGPPMNHKAWSVEQTFTLLKEKPE